MLVGKVGSGSSLGLSRGSDGMPQITPNDRALSETLSACFTPDSVELPHQSSKFPNVYKQQKGTTRINGYAHRTVAVGSPNVLQRLYTGQIPPAYFNELCYGRRATPREYLYRTPTKDREQELWEPKNVSREKARHVTLDIQQARYRRQALYDKQSTKKRKAQLVRTEETLMRHAGIMARGLQAYLATLDKEKLKYEQSIKHKPKKRQVFEVQD